MARAYCQESDVISYLPPNVTIQGSNPNLNFRNPSPETVTDIKIDYFIQQACDLIDAALATQYDIPLIQKRIGGDKRFPPPIPEIAAIWAAQLIWSIPIQGADRQSSEEQKRRWEWAQMELAKIQNGEIRLIGQRNTRANRFVRNTLYNVPRNPAEGGRSKGNNQ